MKSKIKNINELAEKLIFIDEFLINNDLSIEVVAKCNVDHLNELLQSNSEKLDKYLLRIAKYFEFDVELLKDSSKKESDLGELCIDCVLKKVRELKDYLYKNYELELYRAISYKKNNLDEIISGKRKISKRLLNKLSTYFSLPIHFLINNDEELPIDKIILDENLISIQKEDISNEIKREQNRRSFSKNWNILSHSQRVRLFLSSLIVIVPLLGYTSFCAYTLIEDRISMTNEFIAEQTLSEEEQDIISKQDNLLREKGKEKYQTEIKVGMSVANIKNVSNSGMSFSPTVEVFFDFDHEDYFRMIYNYENNADFDERNDYLNDANYVRDDFGYNYQTGEFFKHSDDIPDYMQIEGYAITDSSNPFYTTSYKEFVDKLYDVPGADGLNYMKDETWDALNIDEFEMSQIYAKVISQYPGETTSNVYPDKDGLFSVGHYSGSFDENEFSYGFATPYTLTDENGNISYRYFQSVSFSATIAKVYDSPRYPLDSVSFSIPITAEKLSYEYIKYVPVDYVDLTANQIIYNSDPANAVKQNCSIDSNIFTSGTNPGFKISTAYKLFNSGEIKDISKKVVLRYFVDGDSENEEVVNAINDPTKVFYFSEYQFIIHANRGGISLFLQAFINLFAVVIWIVIAFYDQTYHNESAISMLGTGLFGAISSILVGLSMISEAGMISLITMINVFTLAVILIMTISSISAKRAKIQADQVAMAYNSVKLRVLFITLTICTVIMFVGLPLASFIFY